MKYCTNCGATNLDDAMFCASCGMKFEAPQQSVDPQSTAAAGTPEQGTYTPPVVDANPYAAGAQGAPAASTTSNPCTLWLILNIVMTVLNCCCNPISIVGIIFAAIGMSSFSKGDLGDSKAKAKIAMILFFVALGLGVISFIISLITTAASGGYAQYFERIIDQIS